MNKKFLILCIIAVLAIVGGAIYYLRLEPLPSPEAPAPSDQNPIPPSAIDGSWKTFTDKDSGASFRHPEKLDAKFIHPVEWPPHIKVLNEVFACKETDQNAKPGIKTEVRRLGTQDYCITTASEGAAGSTYTDYTYVMTTEGKTVVLSFTLRFARCENYDESSRSGCQLERATFDIDNVIQKIAESVELKK